MLPPLCSVYHFKPFNATSHKYEDAEDDSNLKTGDAELKLPSDDSIPGQVIRLKQDHEVHKLKIEHLTGKVDKGFETIQGQIESVRQDLRDGFKRTDHWMMLLIGAFILKGGFDTANSAGSFEKKSKEN